MIGTINNITKDYKDNKIIVSIKLDSTSELANIEKLAEDKLDIEIKKYRAKRSLNSNAYCWKLCTEIANVMRADKDEIYLLMLKRYGQNEVISLLATIDIKPYLKYYEEFGESVLNNKTFKHYKVYKGSSEFDSKEMSIFIDGIVSEAKLLNIPTLEDMQIMEMNKQWKI